MQNKEVLERYLRSLGLTYKKLTDGLNEEKRSDFDRIIDNKSSQGGLTFEGTLRTIKFLELEKRVIDSVNTKIRNSYLACSMIYIPICLISSYITFNNNVSPMVRLMSGIYFLLTGHLTADGYMNRKTYRKARQILTQPSSSSQSNK